MLFTKLFATAFVALAVSTLFAKTVYVDCQMDDYAGHDGTSWEKAVKTLTDGINKAAAGDTMLVAKGVYDEGSLAFNADWGHARLQFSNKANMYVKAVDGPLETFIVGEPCTFTENADGSISTNYVRCIQNYNSQDCVVEGFTLMNGDTGVHETRNHNKNGSAVCTDNKTTWLVNCNITGNRGSYDVLMCVNLVNCSVTNNFIVREDGGQLFNSCKIFNTLVANNGCNMNGDIMTGSGAMAVNSTLINNKFLGGPSSAVALYNTVITGSGNVNSSTKVCSVYGDTDFPIMSSLTGDLRVRSGSAAETIGNGKYRTADTFPFDPNGYIDESWRTKDIRGNTVSTADEPIMAGCLQETAVQAGRVLRFTDANAQYSLDGGEFNLGKNTYFIPDVYPTQLVVRVKLAENQRLISLYIQNSPVSRLSQQFPEPNEDYVLFTPGADTTTETTYNFGTAYIGQKVWTDPELDDYSMADGSEEHPYETLQDAVDNTTGNIVILAKPGTYDKGGVAGATQQDRPSNFRLFMRNRTVRVIGVEGAEKTIIKGQPDPDTLGDASLPGCGPKAYKCIGNEGSAYCIEGVTLTGGYSNKSATGGVSYSNMGGAATSVDNNVLVQNCIVTNNTADNYSVSHYVRFNRCIIRDNHSASHAISAGVLTACVLGPNDMASGTELCGNLSYAIQTTIIGNGLRALADNGTTLYNSVLVNGSSTYATPCFGSVIWNVKTISGGTTGFIQANPHLCDENGRLFRDSPALTAGVALVNDDKPEVAFYTKSDMDGSRIDPAVATTFAGAYATPQTAGVYVENATGLDGVKEGVNLPTTGDTVEISPAANWARPIVGAIVNGMPTLFNDTPAGKLVYDATAIAAGNVVVSGIVTANDWYVDDDGDDANDGYFPKKAKRTIQAALDNPNRVNNDRVLVLPGTYSYLDGTHEQKNFGTRTLKSVVVVPNYTTLESTDGPEVTIIQGKAGDTEDPKYYDPMTSMHGIGPGAVRCVYLGQNSVLKGFTLKDGHTRANKDNDYHGNVHNDREFNGGGVTGDGGLSYGKVVDCIIDNCAAFRGGAAFSVTCYNCEFKNSFAIYGGGASSDSDWVQCLSHDNSCYNSSYRAGFFYGSRVISSTIVDGFGDVSNDDKANSITNCLVYGQYNPRNSTTFDVSNIRNCAFNSNASTTVGAASWASLHESSVRVPAAELQLDANYRPVIGANAAIDKGTADVMNAPDFAPYCETDQTGGQRVYNNAIDIGAREADWRAKYATDIAARNLAVTEVSSSVSETDEGKVRLPQGATLKAELTGVTSVKRQVSVRVAGTGTLTVKLNDEVLGTQVGEGEVAFQFENDLALNNLQFDYVGDDGYAEVLNVCKLSGLIMILH